MPLERPVMQLRNRMLPALAGPFTLILAMVACDGSDGSGPVATPPPATGTPAAPATPPAGSPAPTGVARPTVTFEPFVSDFERPTFVTNAGDGSGRMFVTEKGGLIRLIQDGKIAGQPFLNVTPIVKSSGNEQGLLGLAFHPDFDSNGRFFIAYTAQNNDNTVAEYKVSGDAGRADPGSAKILFGVADQFANHNGGMLAFGPDGYLYISMGDGGSGGDPQGNGQNLNALLGKLLRIDVDTGSPYGIPADNPFVGRSGARPEIWAYGLRNPWRFSFDRETGDMWIADVGQNAYEEVDFQAASSNGGENYGWRTMEGAHCFNPKSGCNQEGLVQPVAEYDRDGGCSVTGGYVYRGNTSPALRGHYLYTDYCSGNLWSLRLNGDEFVETELDGAPEFISSFGEDEAGEMYATGDRDGTVYRVVAR